MPPDRAFYALEAILCAVGREAGIGGTLLVDCGVGVLAARGRVVKFTFVQVWKAARLKTRFVHRRDRGLDHRRILEYLYLVFSVLSLL